MVSKTIKEGSIPSRPARLFIMRLKISTGLKVLADFIYADHETRILYVDPNLTASAERWIEDGLFEWVPTEDLSYDKYDDYDTMPRKTRSSDREFLPRLKYYLKRQFPSFIYELSAD